MGIITRFGGTAARFGWRRRDPAAQRAGVRPAVERLEDRTLFNVNVSMLAGNQSEGTTAIDYTNPQRLFAASNNAAATNLFAAYSTDGGTTWLVSDISQIPAGCCDAQAIFDTYGNLYLTYLTRAPEFRTPSRSATTPGNRSSRSTCSCSAVARGPTSRRSPRASAVRAFPKFRRASRTRTGTPAGSPLPAGRSTALAWWIGSSRPGLCPVLREGTLAASPSVGGRGLMAR